MQSVIFKKRPQTYEAVTLICGWNEYYSTWHQHCRNCRP